MNSELISFCDKRPFLKIISIEGSGGIGKTFLLDQFLQEKEEAIANLNFLTMRVSGNLDKTSLIDIVKTLVFSAKGKGFLEPPTYYFPDTVNILNKIEEVKNSVVKEFEAKFPEKDNERNLLGDIIEDIFSLGEDVKNINSPNILKRAKGVKEGAEDLYKLYNDLNQVNIQELGFLERFPGIGRVIDYFSEKSLYNEIRQNACKILAETLSRDIQALVKHFHKDDRWKPKREKLKDTDRLLIILDDYEKLGNHLGVFLVNYFLPMANKYEFAAPIIILGRDRLESTHPAWDQNFKRNLVSRIELQPLSKDEMNSLVEFYGVKTVEEKERAWRDTQGYPFYVQLWQEEISSGGRTAVMLKRFYDRITRWMSEREKVWLEKVIFLNEVNKMTLKSHFGESQIEEVFNWFISEGSLRDTNSKTFCIREYLRSRLVEYFKISDPEKFKELK